MRFIPQSKAGRQRAAVVVALAVLAVVIWAALNPGPAVIVAAVIVACRVLTLAIVVVMARLDRGHRTLRAHGARTIVLNYTAQPGIPVNRAATPGVTRAERTPDVTPPAATQAPPHLPVGVPRHPGAVRDLGDSRGGQRALGRGGLS